MASNEVRIIGGMWKGRKITFPSVSGLRPTLGRTRETLFNWLAARISDARCLDLFAGSGAIGFEALSRGANHVTFVERDRRAATALKRNLARLGADNAKVFSIPAKRFLQRPHAPWDIIFLDPPFASNDFEAALTLIHQNNLLAADGLIYFERPRRETIDQLPHWQTARAARAGDTQFGLLAAANRHTLSV